VKFAFIEAERACFPIAFMCRHLGVSTSGFYASQKRPESTHAAQDRELGPGQGSASEGPQGVRQPSRSP